MFFSGQVQMVGFRFTAVQLARRLKNLSGFVRNMSDGRVEIVAETDEDTFKLLMKEIDRSDLGPGISKKEVDAEDIKERECKSFDIRF